jgi:hypothetical protein
MLWWLKLLRHLSEETADQHIVNMLDNSNDEKLSLLRNPKNKIPPPTTCELEGYSKHKFWLPRTMILSWAKLAARLKFSSTTETKRSAQRKESKKIPSEAYRVLKPRGSR